MYQHIPNVLTFSRLILAIPLAVVAFFSDLSPACHVLALGLMGYVIISDYLDGRLARRWRVVSDWGKKLDPVADKFVDVAMYLTLVFLQPTWLLAFLLMVVIFRHAVVTIVRRLAKRCQLIIAARPSGKWRTALSFFLVFLLLARVQYRTSRPHWLIDYAHRIPSWLLESAMWLVLIVTVISLYDYCRAHWEVITRRGYEYKA